MIKKKAYTFILIDQYMKKKACAALKDEIKDETKPFLLGFVFFFF